MRDLIERLTSPPRFVLPPASQGHTRHYMPLVNDDRTKVFDTFIAVEPDDAVVAIWPAVSLTDEQRHLLDDAPGTSDAEPIELGEAVADDREWIRTLVPVLADEHAERFTHTHASSIDSTNCLNRSPPPQRKAYLWTN